MRYYSDKTQKFYATEKECLEAEVEAKKAENLARIEKERQERELKEKKEKDAAERKAMAAEIEEARKAMVAAQKAYSEKLQAFVNRWHTYHYTTSDVNEIPSLFSLFDKFFL